MCIYKIYIHVLVSWSVYSIFCTLHHVFHPKIQHYTVHIMSHCSWQQMGLKPHVMAWTGKWQPKQWVQTTFPRDESKQPSPRKSHSFSSAATAQGALQPGQGGTLAMSDCSPPAPISSTALIPISASQDQEHRVTLTPCPQSSRSLFLPIVKTILSFIFYPKLFSCGQTEWFLKIKTTSKSPGHNNTGTATQLFNP